MKQAKSSLIGVAAATLGLVIVISSFASPALAAINFKSGPTCTAASQNRLECQGRATGLGNTATASLTATASVTQGCINRGSQGQQPSGLQTTSRTVTATQPLDVRNGGANFDLLTQQISPTNSCPDRMQPVVVCVIYSNIAVTIESSTGSRTQSVPGTVSTC